MDGIVSRYLAARLNVCQGSKSYRLYQQKDVGTVQASKGPRSRIIPLRSPI